MTLPQNPKRVILCWQNGTDHSFNFCFQTLETFLKTFQNLSKLIA